MRKRRAFCLIELVVVVLILGTLAGVAAPKLLSSANSATESALKQSLRLIRDAIELYAADHEGALPGADGTESTLKSDLTAYLRGDFPFNTLKGTNSISVQTNGAPLTSAIGGSGWRYDNSTGQFIINSNGLSSDGVTRYCAL